MKNFKLDQNGDVVITNNEIELAYDMDLIVQTLRQVLGTNLGEWFGDESEGIDYQVILTKNPNYDLIQDTINTAVQQVSDNMGVNLEVSDFDFTVNGRSLTIDLTLTMEEESQSITLTL